MKNEATHKQAVQTAFTNYTQACATLADVIAKAMADGASREQIVEWGSEVASSSHISRLLCEMGVRVRGKRSDAGKKRTAKQAGEDVAMLLDVLGEVFSEPANSTRNPAEFSIENVAKRVVKAVSKHCNGNEKRIVRTMGQLTRKLNELAGVEE